MICILRYGLKEKDQESNHEDKRAVPIRRLCRKATPSEWHICRLWCRAPPGELLWGRSWPGERQTERDITSHVQGLVLNTRNCKSARLLQAPTF